MKRYQLIESGRECGPEFDTLEEARAALTDAVVEAKQDCRRVYGNATARALGKDSCAVTPWHDSSVLWTTLSILS
jgi:hypothetical protein